MRVPNGLAIFVGGLWIFSAISFFAVGVVCTVFFKYPPVRMFGFFQYPMALSGAAAGFALIKSRLAAGPDGVRWRSWFRISFVLMLICSALWLCGMLLFFMALKA